MITDRIGRDEVLLLITINHKNYNFREKKKTKVFEVKAPVAKIKIVSLIRAQVMNYTTREISKLFRITLAIA